MEQHAVPQDITGFKFKLVGDMTLKQFGELAAGAILAYMFYASSWHPFLKWPFVLLFGFLGVALAFIPIEERPLDLWILNFFRAIYQPTLYVWRRDVGGKAYLVSSNMTTKKPAVQKPIVADKVSEEPGLGLTPWPFKSEGKEEKREDKDVAMAEPEIKELVSPPAPLSVGELQKLREEKLAQLEEAKKKLQEVTRVAKEESYKSRIAPNTLTIDQLAKLREEKVAQQHQELSGKVAVGEAQLNSLISQSRALGEQIDLIRKKIFALGNDQPGELKVQLDQLLAQKNDLAEKIKNLQDELATQRATPLIQPAYIEPRVTATLTPGVKVMDRPIEKDTAISLSDQPNVISGMITTEKGAPLEGVIVLIKDSVGNSIRALKTNRVGQFVVATPMENGKYYVELEKAGFRFNVLEITLDGKVIPPLEITAST